MSASHHSSPSPSPTPPPSPTPTHYEEDNTSIPIIDVSYSNIEIGTGYKITNEQTIDTSGNDSWNTTFISTNPELYDPDITENLTQSVEIYNDELDPNSQNSILINQIKSYASQITCSDFHGKGTIDDYAGIFEAACNIASTTTQMSLDIDIDGFNEFSQAADDLSNLFQSFTLKLKNVNIINDTDFLTAIMNALEKIVNLSNVFGKFKETILMTTTIELPKSIQDTRIVIEGVMGELDCAMQYITNFVNPTDDNLIDAKLSEIEKTIISKAVTTIESWSSICEQGVTIAMSDNLDIKYIKTANTKLKTTTNVLKTTTQNLKIKFNNYLHC